MDSETWEVVDEVQGQMQAAIIQSMLESYGLSVWVSQEGAGQAYPINIGTLGRVQILVPKHQEEKAQEILRQYHAGEMELPDDEEGQPGEETPS
jgi:hypothetical protein